MRHDDGLAAQARFETVCGIADWLSFEVTPRRIILRRPVVRTFTQTERAAMDAARTFLDKGDISILCRQRGGQVTYLAERVK